MKQTILIEASHRLGHIVMKRRRLHLNGGASGLQMAMRRPDKSWLSAYVEACENPWDAAHSAAAKLKAELKEQVYAEPGEKAGRFSELTAPDMPMGDSSGMEGFNPNPNPDRSANFGASPFALPGAPGGGNIHGMPGFGSSFVPGIPHSGGFAGFGNMQMPTVPDPLAFLPAQVRGMLGGQAQEKSHSKGRLTCPALYELPGWSELPEALQQMFEVEACQVLAEHSFGLDVDGGLSKLLAAPLSKALRKFLDGAFSASLDK
jgi:hypothetical protein